MRVRDSEPSHKTFISTRWHRFMTYPPCPHCDHELPVGDFFEEVGARRLSSFDPNSLSASSRFRKDRSTNEYVPLDFSIMCARCGATSAVHTTERDYIVLLYVVAGLVVVLGVLWLAGITGTYSRLLCVTAYLAACAPFLRVASLFFPPVMTVTLTALPAPE